MGYTPLLFTLRSPPSDLSLPPVDEVELLKDIFRRLDSRNICKLTDYIGQSSNKAIARYKGCLRANLY